MSFRSVPQPNENAPPNVTGYYNATVNGKEGYYATAAFREEADGNLVLDVAVYEGLVPIPVTRTLHITV